MVEEMHENVEKRVEGVAGALRKSVTPMSVAEIKALGLASCPRPEWEIDWVRTERHRLGRRD